MTNITFFKISGKNELKFLTEEDKKQNMEKIYSMLIELQDEKIGNEINKYISLRIPKFDKDPLSISNEIMNVYIKDYQINFKNDSFNEIINKLLSNPNQKEFIINKKNNADLTKILCCCFSQFKKYKIKKINELESKIKEVDFENINVEQYYRNNNYYRNNSISFMNKTFSTFKIQNGKYLYPTITSEKKPKFSLPIELIILLYKFKDITKFIINLEGTDHKRKLENVLICLNINWLFPKLNEIEFNFIDEDIQKGLNQIYDMRISQILNNKEILLKSTNYDNKYKRNDSFLPFGYISLLNKSYSPFEHNKNLMNETFNQKSGFIFFDNINDSFKGSTYDNTNSFEIENENSSRNSTQIKKDLNYQNKNNNLNAKNVLEDFVVKNIHPFENIVFFSHYISKIKNIYKLKLSFNDSFSYEIEVLLKKKNSDISNFSFLIFLYKLYELKELTIDFNSIDTISFEKILSIIQRNRNLEKIHISFFTPEENYSPINLIKLYASRKLSLRNLFEEQQKFLTNNLFKNFEYNDIDYFLIGRKFNKEFEENFYHFFYIIQTKTNLKELCIFLDTPTIIITNPFYINILTISVFNFFTWLSLCNNSIKIFKIICPLLNLNSTIYPHLIDLFNETILTNNNILEELTIQFQFYNILNLSNLISFNLKYLFLGDLDFKSFESFIQFYSSNNFISKSNLISIKISLNMTITSYNLIEKSIKTFILYSPKNLQEKILLSSIEILDEKQLKELHNLIYYKDKTKFICIQISNSSDESNNNVLIDLHNEVQNKLFNIGFIFSKKPFNEMNKEKIRKKIKSFFQIPKNKKIIYCHDKRDY